jgi:D-arabinose 1-dehydrogenase-like Zn-dependent alcohol dehydrogenase
MLCKKQKIPGQSYYYGGYAEYMSVPTFRFLYKIGDLDPSEAAPLADAGVTSLSAVRKALPFVNLESLVVAYGVGGLASYGIQFLRLLAPTCKILAVSRKKEKLDWAISLGADYASLPQDLKQNVEKITQREGSSAAIDFVGTEESTMNIATSLGAGGAIIEVGMEGEKLSMPTFGTTVWQYHLVGSNYGTFNELAETVELVRSGKVKSYLTKVRLDKVNEALVDLKNGSIMGRYVLVP